MGIPTSSGFNLNTARPLDLRTTTATLTTRDAMSATLRYQGLRVYVIAEAKEYQLIGGIGNGNWVEAISATPVSNILEWSGTAYRPYTVTGAGKLDSSVTTPTGSTRLNYSGNFHATQLYEGVTRVSVAGHTHTGVYEPVLGIPDATGKVLTSTIPGVRSWVTPLSLLPGATLSKVDDTNVTLTLSGNPLTALLRNTTLTLGWTGKLADSRIASAEAWNAMLENAGEVKISGTPALNQVAVWDSVDHLRGDSKFTWDGTDLMVTGNIKATGEVTAYSSGPTPPPATAEPVFADPLILDATVSKNFKCGVITGNTVITLTNTVDGDSGIIALFMNGTGGYTVTLSGFTVLLRNSVDYVDAIDTSINGVTIIEYWNVLDTILYRFNLPG